MNLENAADHGGHSEHGGNIDLVPDWGPISSVCPAKNRELMVFAVPAAFAVVE